SAQDQLIRALAQLQIRHFDSPVAQRCAEHQRIPLARLPLKIVRLKPERQGCMLDVMRLPPKRELAFFDRPARRVREAEECGKRRYADLREVSAHVDSSPRLVVQGLNLRAQAAAKGG